MPGLKVGLTGGLASGKSFVGQALVELGCFLIKADELGHQVLMPCKEAYGPVIREFGAEILQPDGTIDRRKLGAVVFGNPEKLAILNGFVHPPVQARQQQLLRDFWLRQPQGIAIVEAAILIETGSHTKFDRLILAICTMEQQIERSMHRDNLSREEVQERLSRQMPLSEKIPYAHYVVDTSGTKESTIEQTREVNQSLRSLTE